MKFDSLLKEQFKLRKAGHPGKSRWRMRKRIVRAIRKRAARRDKAAGADRGELR
jgi:hypothetical protein